MRAEPVKLSAGPWRAGWETRRVIFKDVAWPRTAPARTNKSIENLARGFMGLAIDHALGGFRVSGADRGDLGSEQIEFLQVLWA